MSKCEDTTKELYTHLLLEDVQVLERLDRREVVGDAVRQVQCATLEVDDIHEGCGDGERGEVHGVGLVKLGVRLLCVLT